MAEMTSACITGGTGTLGRALLRAMLPDPRWRRIVCLARDEAKMAETVAHFGHHAAFRAFLGDVRDRDRLEWAFEGCDVVINCAALKRVTEGLYSAWEIMETNVKGTMNVAAAAIRAGVKKVLFISSDKSCSPLNLYGASKMCGEHVTIQSNAYGFPRGTRLSAVRYGNVLGSRGSAVGLWLRQARRGEPLTLTDPAMSRFWWTADHAAAFVLWAVNRIAGGEVLVPFLPSATVEVVARAVAEVAGVVYRATVTGVRPGGEKLHEQLVSSDEVERTCVPGRVSSEWPTAAAILPSYAPWTAAPLYPDWIPLSRDSWHYFSSGLTPNVLTHAELVEMIRKAESDQEDNAR